MESPQQRRSLLLNMRPSRGVVTKYHDELIALFQREVDYRRAGCPNDDEADYFENIYWCALLLYLVGDPADVPMMWNAKNIDMDLATGFDVQFLVGAGVEETINYLQLHHKNEIATYVNRCKEARDFDNLAEWERSRISYFYPDGSDNDRSQ